MPPGFLFSHASSRAARSLAFVQWRSTCDRVILGPLQNQQLLSVRLRILFRNTAEHQWPVLIWAAVLAMEFLALSMHDFFGGGGGISSVPWCLGSAWQVSFAVRNLSDDRSLRKAREMTGDQLVFSDAAPASRSTFSLPGISHSSLTLPSFRSKNQNASVGSSQERPS